MNMKSLFKQIGNSSFTTITEEQMEGIRNSSKLVYEEDTLISDFIRIYKVNDLYIFQEKTPKGEILIRKFENESEAKDLMSNRLDIYEKMWNGCGCKINYFK